MTPTGCDGQARYVIPAGARWRVTPAGALQVDGEGGEASVEVPREWAEAFLGFARPRSADEAWRARGGGPAADRDGWRERVQAWAAQGLLRQLEGGPPEPTRLTLFAAAAERHVASGARRFPLHSQFPLQRPVVFYPGLETLEVHERRHFPWVAALENAFPVIQRELHALLGAGPGFAPAYRSHTSAGEWTAALLWAYGRQADGDTCRHCPETVRLLRAIPGVAQFGTTLYSALAPHTWIAPHFGYTNAKLRCQLPLIVPGACTLKVGDHEIEQVEGRCIVFDDSFLHSAWNDSDEPRVVLVFDFFHPDLTAPEVAYLAALVERWQLAKPYAGEESGGQRGS